MLIFDFDVIYRSVCRPGKLSQFLAWRCEKAFNENVRSNGAPRISAAFLFRRGPEPFESEREEQTEPDAERD